MKRVGEAWVVAGTHVDDLFVLSGLSGNTLCRGSPIKTLGEAT